MKIEGREGGEKRGRGGGGRGGRECGHRKGKRWKKGGGRGKRFKFELEFELGGGFQFIRMKMDALKANTLSQRFAMDLGTSRIVLARLDL